MSLLYVQHQTLPIQLIYLQVANVTVKLVAARNSSVT